ncbi:MAG: hypothetical protein GY774_16570 [Planctomycetes bacterium]|nr:hypothetical protein [Planctomycetota bacterium]
MSITLEKTEPIKIADLKKGIRVPCEHFEKALEFCDWTYHQLARGEFPEPYTSLEEFQLAIINTDPVLWVQAFLKEPEDPDHQDPYNLWDYQKESLRYPGHAIHKDGSEVGKTREIVGFCLYKAFTTPNGSGLIGAPLQGHLDEIIEAMDEQLTWNPDLGRSRQHPRIKGGWKKHPYHTWYFHGRTHRFKIDFRPSSHDGAAYRGIHARTFAIKDEAAKDKNKKQWSEFWRAMKPSCVARIYSVPDGDRSCEFYKLGQRACKGEKSSALTEIGQASSLTPTNNSKQEHEGAPNDSFKGAAKHIQNIRFRLFNWPKTFMPHPFWSAERKKFYIEQYGGEDAPEYKHNILGTDGDPEYSVFPWEHLKHCIREIQEYRFLKVLVDSANDDVIITGYKYGQIPGDNGPVPVPVCLLDEVYAKSGFFDYDEHHESDFRKLIKTFFNSVPGLKYGGGDFGFSPDPTELIVKNIIGKKDRYVARLQLKSVTYDQQCQALDALDDVYGPMESVSWGTDYGNAGSAVAHDLQGLPQYAHKDYEDRLRGFNFESTTDNIDEDGDSIIEARTGKPAKITMKELATDIMTKKIQRLETEYPADPDFAFYYPNHTVRKGKHRIYKNTDDHLIDAERCEILGRLFNNVVEDIFARAG